MFRRSRFFKADGGGGSPAPTAVGDILTNHFGTAAESSRPDLGLIDTKEPERPKPDEQPPPTDALLTDAPAKAPEKPATEEKPAGEEGATPEKPAGDEPPAAEEGRELLDSILSKYRSKPEALARSERADSLLAYKTPEERTAAKQKLEAMLSVHEKFFETDANGQFRLRTDEAARALRDARNPRNVPPAPDEKALRKTVESELTQLLGAGLEEEDVETYMAQPEIQQLIDQTTKARSEVQRAQHEAAVSGAMAEVSQILADHFTAHPQDKPLIGKISAVYEGIPEEIRPLAILENWLPLDQVAEMVRLREQLPSIVEEAFKAGLQARKKAVVPKDAGSPGSSGPGATGRTGAATDPTGADFKAQILRAGGGLPGVESFLTPR